jgi:hypothetical protein
MMFLEISDPATGRGVMLNGDAILMVVQDEKGQARVLTFSGAAVDTGLNYVSVRDAIYAAEESEEEGAPAP